MEALFEPEYEEQSSIGDNPEEDLKLLLDAAKELINNEEDKKLLEKAFWFCVDKHSAVIRKSGKPYYSHPVKVALLFIEEFPVADLPSVISCLLHDTIEDVEDVTKESVAKEFSEEIAEIVDGVTKITFTDSSKGLNKAHTYKKIFLGLVKDIRVILIKLADRLHNIRTLHYLKDEKRRVIAQETLNFYTPLAHKLGLSRVKMELENLSFYYTDQSSYEAIREALTSKRREFIDYIKMFTNHIQTALNDANLKHTLSIIHKHEYEIYQIIQEGKAVSDIDNFYSIVIILDTNDIKECYTAHGVLANAFNTINFIDYISNPNLDWYRSLNSEIYGPDGKKIEILIRTQEMEQIAEEGFATVFSLDKGRTRALTFSDEEIDQWSNWMSDVIESKGEDAIPLIWNSIKVNLFDTELAVFDKVGNQYNLPNGSSILDFAFKLSKEHGLHCISGKVNGLIKDIAYKLENGDQVEIIKSPNSAPKPEWQKFVVTNKAVIELYDYFKTSVVGLNINEENDFKYELKIIGEDKEEMLKKITSAIGQHSMVSVKIDSTGNMFDGSISLNMPDRKSLNKLFANLFLIDGIRSVKIL